MTKTSFFVFFTFCEIFKIVCCGNDAFNPFGLQVGKKTENLKLDEEQKKLILENNSIASDTKNLEKRRLFFPGNEINAEFQSDRFSISGEHPSKRLDLDKTEDEHGFSGEIRDFESDHWENEKSKFSFMEEKGNTGSSIGFLPRQPISGLDHTHALDKSDFPEKSDFQWNRGKNFKHERPNYESKIGSQYTGKSFNGNFNDYSDGKSGNIFDKKISITTLNKPEVRNQNKYNSDYRDERRFGYHVHSNIDYNNQKESSYRDPNIYKKERGVIINFNTECPMTRQFSNQLLHKVIISPKPSLDTQSEITMYQYPRAGLISAHQLAPTYYF